MDAPANQASNDAASPESALIERRIQQRIGFLSGRLEELTESIATQMKEPFFSRDLRVLLLLRREQAKHARLLRELKDLIGPEA